MGWLSDDQHSSLSRAEAAGAICERHAIHLRVGIVLSKLSRESSWFVRPSDRE
jgi:hypothetical protein